MTISEASWTTEPLLTRQMYSPESAAEACGIRRRGPETCGKKETPVLALKVPSLQSPTDVLEEQVTLPPLLQGQKVCPSRGRRESSVLTEKGAHVFLQGCHSWSTSCHFMPALACVRNSHAPCPSSLSLQVKEVERPQLRSSPIPYLVTRGEGTASLVPRQAAL